MNFEWNIWEYFDSAGKLNQKYYVENANFGATANLFVRHSVFVKYGFFLSILESGGDYEFCRRVTKSGEVLLFASNALVFHPARSSLKSKLAKSKRIAEGQRKLSRMGLLDHGQLDWRQLLLRISYPTLPEVKLRRHEKMSLIIIYNCFQYYNFFKRV